jgi:hypothetical protein
MFQQARPRIGKDHATAIALEQVLTEFHFELAHLTAQGGLDHREKGRGAREAAEFRDMAKVFELL